MRIRQLDIEGAFVVTPQVFGDDRGMFLEWFKAPVFREAAGNDLTLAQANCSVSAAGTVRGIHFADVPPGQAKYVTCVAGSVLDVVVDVRVGSPTFGRWEAVPLNTEDRAAVYLSEGLGHGFVALEDNSTVVYLCSTTYNPSAEHEIHPFDPELGIEWGIARARASLSAKDAGAPGLTAARAAGLLPDYEQCRQFRASLG
ncbi:MAG: dTDP-4-dehydrorhamnose 3,5-epimerase [Actinobacteria bacterium]|nr:dTDP-4-dehydrorhamnose 3,5-epimerase [Actinomycetota bacterium]MCB8996984.1 dTDP-4-dehydrorhamnose 3,5-epimerase [Actinomycetota bacterium]MCB9414025.1 dTDP-4-dehydrorhamnose 3,5-epimerase [Actinomycetota bacterium]MCB9424534.1 dTDP-4-dehydrorhamnose 3,5-epimerase [Actinomycetota bacterium]HRY08622.1 dTDP-4-dehydrorhamnose 3,5-epimerase [Candidatus Nanopelagicales bacterium]